VRKLYSKKKPGHSDGERGVDELTEETPRKPKKSGVERNDYSLKRIILKVLGGRDSKRRFYGKIPLQGEGQVKKDAIEEFFRRIRTRWVTSLRKKNDGDQSSEGKPVTEKKNKTLLKEASVRKKRKEQRAELREGALLGISTHQRQRRKIRKMFQMS